MEKCEIPTVGKLIKFVDPEGNYVCAIRHDKDYVG
jgi:hypothetical protein